METYHNEKLIINNDFNFEMEQPKPIKNPKEEAKVNEVNEVINLEYFNPETSKQESKQFMLLNKLI